MPQPEQVALDRVRPRLEPIITRRRTAARPPRATQQRAHDQAARLRRDRRASPGRYQRRRARRRRSDARSSGTASARSTRRARHAAHASGHSRRNWTSRPQPRAGLSRAHEDPTPRKGLAIRPPGGYSSDTCICRPLLTERQWFEAAAEDRVRAVSSRYRAAAAVRLGHGEHPLAGLREADRDPLANWARVALVVQIHRNALETRVNRLDDADAIRARFSLRIAMIRCCGPCFIAPRRSGVRVPLAPSAREPPCVARSSIIDSRAIRASGRRAVWRPVNSR